MSSKNQLSASSQNQLSTFSKNQYCDLETLASVAVNAHKNNNETCTKPQLSLKEPIQTLTMTDNHFLSDSNQLQQSRTFRSQEMGISHAQALGTRYERELRRRYPAYSIIASPQCLETENLDNM